MIKKSAIITDNIMKSGSGIYSARLYMLGFIETLRYYQYNKKNSDYMDNITSIKPKFYPLIWGITTGVSYYLGGVYKKDVQKYDFVHLASQGIFHLSKWNKNSTGTLHDFFGLKYSSDKMISNWSKKNIEFVKKLKGVVTISDHIKKEAEERYPDVEFTRIHLWLDDKEFMPRDKKEVRKKIGLEEDKIYLLNVGRDVPRKNLDILPEIMRRLDDRFVLIRIGDTSRIANRFKSKQLIVLQDLPNEIYPLYFNCADILLHPAYDGGFEIPLLEAIKSELQVLGSDSEIIREVFQNKGVFLNSKDPDEWVENILKYYDRKMNFPDLKKYYSEERAKKEYEKFYHDLGII